MKSYARNGCWRKPSRSGDDALSHAAPSLDPQKRGHAERTLLTIPLSPAEDRLGLTIQLIADLVGRLGAVVTEVDVRSADDASFTLRVPSNWEPAATASSP